MHDVTLSIGRALVVTWVLCASAVAAAQERTWQVTQGRVTVVCPLTVGGRFEAKTTAVTGKVTTAEGSRHVAGAFVVDLTTLQTGIGLRDLHLRDNYLEVSRGPGYDTAVLDAIVLDAPVPARGQSAVLGFNGVLTLHGRGNPVSGRVELASQGDRLDVKVTFPLRIDVYAIARPVYLGVGVTNQVQVSVRATLNGLATPAS